MKPSVENTTFDQTAMIRPDTVAPMTRRSRTHDPSLLSECRNDRRSQNFRTGRKKPTPRTVHLGYFTDAVAWIVVKERRRIPENCMCRYSTHLNSCVIRKLWIRNRLCDQEVRLSRSFRSWDAIERDRYVGNSTLNDRLQLPNVPSKSLRVHSILLRRM
jgi:hypothetical protein